MRAELVEWASKLDEEQDWVKNPRVWPGISAYFSRTKLSFGKHSWSFFYAALERVNSHRYMRIPSSFQLCVEDARDGDFTALWILYESRKQRAFDVLTTGLR